MVVGTGEDIHQETGLLRLQMIIQTGQYLILARMNIYEQTRQRKNIVFQIHNITDIIELISVQDTNQIG